MPIIKYKRNTMEKQTTKLDQLLKISGIIGVLIITLSISYYVLAFLPQKEQTRLEEQRRERAAEEADAEKDRQEQILKDQAELAKIEQNKKLYKNCVAEALAKQLRTIQLWSDYEKSVCDKAPNPSLGIDCLKNAQEKVHESDDTLKYDQDYCLKLYPQQ